MCLGCIGVQLAGPNSFSSRLRDFSRTNSAASSSVWGRADPLASCLAPISPVGLCFCTLGLGLLFGNVSDAWCWAAWVRPGQGAAQDTGLAQVQLEGEGLETVVRVDRPAKPGERLSLRCAFTDARAGLYRLEEALPSLADPDVPGSGEAAEGETGEEEVAESGIEAEDRIFVSVH